MGLADLLTLSTLADATPTNLQPWGHLSRPAFATLARYVGAVALVTEYGAVGGSATIGAGALAQARIDSGQAWLIASDTLDLLAFYKAQKALTSQGGGVLVFPNLGRDYQFSATGFVHSHIDIDLGGSTVRMTGDGTRYVRSDVCFLWGVLAREDYPRFAAQGWYFTAANIAAGSITITGVSGGTWSPGDAVMIRTTAEDATIPTSPVPTISTLNIVKTYSAGTMTLEHPMEQAITAPLLFNFSTNTTLKSSLVSIGEPHVYYAAVDCRLRNGTVVGLNNAAIKWDAVHGLDVDIISDSPRGNLAYGNGLCRSTVRLRQSRWGGVKMAIEVGTMSTLSTIDVDAEYSGDGYNPDALVETAYDIIKTGEGCFGMHVKARMRAYNKIYAFGLRAGGTNCTYDLDIESEGINSAGVVFITDGSTGGQTVWGRLKSSSCAWHADFAGVNDTLRDFVFQGVPATDAVRFRDVGNGKVVNCVFPSGKPVFTGTSGNVLTGGYVHSPPTATSGTNRIQTLTQFGPFPNAIQTQTRSSTGTIGYDQAWGTLQHTTGAAALITVTLPLALIGMQVRMLRNNVNFAVRLDPQGTNTIGGEAAGKYISLDTDQAFVDLVCAVANRWAIAGASGTISVEP